MGLFICTEGHHDSLSFLCVCCFMCVCVCVCVCVCCFMCVCVCVCVFVGEALQSTGEALKQLAEVKDSLVCT